MKISFILLLLIILLMACTQKVDSEIESQSAKNVSNKEDANMEVTEKEAIQQVVEKAYIRGIHGNQDEKAVKGGFHKDFNMLVLQNNTIEKVTVDEWLDRVEKMKADNPQLWEAETTYNFEFIDFTSYAAVAKLDVYKGKTHFSTDYMLLYRFEDGWKIVSKIFAIPH
ncbi:MAG: hypothetical protein GTO17_09225 [Candidatus Aminicenantes bacterium]|nr:hypothetical protein [Candidatus Aminicenantes bacterium]